MNKPDLMAELAKFVRLDEVAIELSYYDGIGEREGRDEFAVNFLRTRHAELEAVARDAALLDVALRHAGKAVGSHGVRFELRFDPMPVHNGSLRYYLEAAMHNSAREG